MAAVFTVFLSEAIIGLLVVSLCTGQPFSNVYVTYDPMGKVFSLTKERVSEWVAHGQFQNAINNTGWAFLKVESNQSYPDTQQAYAAGLAEGYLTEELINLHWTNTLQGYCPQPYSDFCWRLYFFLDQNLEWMKSQIKLGDNPAVPFWHQVELFLYQSAGLADGMKKQLTANVINMEIEPFGPFFFQVGGDAEDLESVLGKSNIERPLGSGSCSALVKLLPNNEDLYVAQDTWGTFQSMLRIIKVYDFPFKMVDASEESIPGRVQVFSSYPGTLMSGDDYYMLSSGMVSMETTIGNNNPDLWKYVQPESVLEGIRSVVANRISKSGDEWAKTFSFINSGTYNNEWMIVDYKRFSPGAKTLVPGLLTVLDQIPGTIKYADLTDLLASQQYFPSYNVAYFPEIFNMSGNQAMVEKFGDWFTYSKTPRALIFARDQQWVYDIKSMTKLMRFNDFKEDPLAQCNCTPPYSGENAISARSDLNPANGTYPFGALGHRQHGGIDMKLTSSKMFRSLSMVAVGGPTWDENPPFQWSKSDFVNLSHVGQPDLWKFSPFLFNSTTFFR
ncbi:hypothetical protein BaRGS_00031336 [Batillaria attramentaria]|uniref:Phospholipase B-like n=1 Tax=Batillaria attramentaria TaxID=370345 RepID=A0ABD0JRW4_9CAEN